jgi:hypothetical protein
MLLDRQPNVETLGYFRPFLRNERTGQLRDGLGYKRLDNEGHLA